MLPRMIRIGPFDLDVPVGRGGMGEVWRGTHRASLAPVAIKVLHRHLGHSERHLGRLHTEVRAMARLDHPGIAYVVDVGDVPASAEAESNGQITAGSAFIAMEYASGGSLSSRCGKLDWPAQRALLIGLLNALAHAHARGVIHRDLKPGNVLLARPRDLRPGWKICDFGLSRAAEAGTDATRHETVGTPHFMAPEQVDREFGPHGPWTDLYSFGCLAWAIATGRPPFGELRGADAAWAHLTRTVPRLEPACPVPTGLEPWLRRLLARHPDARFAVAADALAELRELPERDPLTPEDETARGHPLERAVRARPSDYVPTSWQTRTPTFPPALRGAGLGLIGLRVPHMVGRMEERDRLWELLLSLRSGSQVVFLYGQEGSGRSRLAAWLGQRAHEVGAASCATVQVIAGEPRERALSSLIERLVHSEQAGTVPPWLETGVGRIDLGEARRNDDLIAILGRTRPVEASLLRAVLLSLVERRAATRPLLLILDDIHLAPGLVDVVAELNADPKLSALPVLWILTARADGLPVLQRATERLASTGSTVLHLEPLDPLSRKLLLQEHGLTPAVAAGVDERSGGNPKALTDRVIEWAGRGWLGPGPTGFQLAPGVDAWAGAHTAWAERVGRVLEGLPEPALQALEMAAALGLRVEATEWRLTGAGGVEPQAGAALATAEARLIAAHLAEDDPDGFVFTQPGARDALIERAQSAGRWRLHNQACATMLLERPRLGNAERIGRHLLEAGRAADAIDWLLEGAEGRARTAGPSAALQLLAQADTALTGAGIGPADPRWSALFLCYARENLTLGAPGEAAIWAERARATGRRHRLPQVVAEAECLLGEAALSVLDLDRAERLLLEACAGALAAGAWGVAGQARLGLSQVLAALGEAGRSGKMAEHAQANWAQAGTASAASAATRCEGWRHLVAGNWTGARETLVSGRAQARERADTLAAAELLALECTALRRSGAWALAEVGLRELTSEYALLGHRGAARAWSELALVQLAGAQWAAAYETLAVEGAGYPPLPGSADAELRVAVEAAAAAATGRWTEVGPALERAEAGMVNRPIGLPDVRWCLGLVRDRAAATGGWDHARRADLLAADHDRKPMSLV